MAGFFTYSGDLYDCHIDVSGGKSSREVLFPVYNNVMELVCHITLPNMASAVTPTLSLSWNLTKLQGNVCLCYYLSSSLSFSLSFLVSRFLKFAAMLFASSMESNFFRMFFIAEERSHQIAPWHCWCFLRWMLIPTYLTGSLVPLWKSIGSFSLKIDAASLDHTLFGTPTWGRKCSLRNEPQYKDIFLNVHDHFFHIFRFHCPCSKSSSLPDCHLHPPSLWPDAPPGSFPQTADRQNAPGYWRQTDWLYPGDSLLFTVGRCLADGQDHPLDIQNVILIKHRWTYFRKAGSLSSKDRGNDHLGSICLDLPSYYGRKKYSQPRSCHPASGVSPA